MSYVVYKFEFKVDGLLNATRLVTFKSDQYATVFVDHCRKAWDWACKKPGRHVLAVGPDNTSSLVCPQLIDAVIEMHSLEQATQSLAVFIAGQAYEPEQQITAGGVRFEKVYGHRTVGWFVDCNVDHSAWMRLQGYDPQGYGPGRIEAAVPGMQYKLGWGTRPMYATAPEWAAYLITCSNNCD